ncbi:alcohol dehydrogenase catalytic domain-containing protein [Auraticoccus sp. F435]|uniref:alcohol dehydrogenase (NADP(+)) n=1 Tax=Auraticoccus cholistanensis TaxID=2656650 RepID=A0A6A9V240_9ACTN|nr:NAD(P)-dependent alcohol dehydrogenase [Auraticoccus cholistanensis]MVA77653.1 alcohol dehydrogenase catalytic domain-containing protein [Auraticoccus cholistanensis]
MPQAAAYATPSAGAPFAATTITRREPGPTEVLVDIAWAGICHSDIHTAREEWGKAHFPLVPGHEIAGTVAQVGPEVTKFAVGDRIGVGVFVDSCRECPECRSGNEQYCSGGGMVGTYNAKGRDGRWNDGGYSTAITVEQDYALRIPEGIDLAEAAPLLCAGITLYSPLRHWGAGPGKKVAIVGMGGLGHMGVKLAAAMGAEVTVLSQTLSKKEDGERFGATHYHATSDPETFRALARSFDLIISTVSADLDMNAFLGLLKVDGTLVNVGLPENPLSVRAGALAGARRSLAGSNIGGIAETQEMLDFCAEHGLGATVEKISGDEITAAYDRVVASDVRYRFVIDTSTFPAVS